MRVGIYNFLMDKVSKRLEFYNFSFLVSFLIIFVDVVYDNRCYLNFYLFYFSTVKIISNFIIIFEFVTVMSIIKLYILVICRFTIF